MSRAKQIARFIELHVAPENVARFSEISERNARASRKEPGNLRFELHQSWQDPTIFFLHEVFADEAAVHAHRETAHYKEWKQTAEPMIISPRKTTDCRIVFSDQL